MIQAKSSPPKSVNETMMIIITSGSFKSVRGMVIPISISVDGDDGKNGPVSKQVPSASTTLFRV